MNYLRKKSVFSKILLALFSLFLVGQCVSIEAQTCQPVAPDLVSWWSGDGNALDARSRNNGAMQYGANFDAGRVGLGFNFDGVDDAILLGNPSSLNLSSITIEAWIHKRGSTPNGIENILAKWGFDASVDGYLFGVVSSGIRSVAPFGAIGDGVTGDNGFSGGSFNSKSWAHLAMTYNAADGINKLYVNGAEVASRTRPNGIFPTASNVYFGREASSNQRFFRGVIDELAVYSRALSAAEIQAVYNAGSAGKCKSTATVAPANLAGFWSGDGDATDTSGNGNNGALLNGAGYAVGKAGEAFNLDGGDDYVSVPHNSNQNVAGAFSGEAWIYPRSVSAVPRIFAKGTAGNQWLLYLANPHSPVMVLHMETGSGIAQVTTPQGLIQLNQWNHVAFTHNYNGTYSYLKLYVNGVLSAVAPFGSKQTVNYPGIFYIGSDSTSQAYNFDGIIDEPAIYQSELSQAEIESIYNAGSAGKLKTAHAPVGAPTTIIGETRVNFGNVVQAGTTQVIPLNPNLFPALPAGKTHAGLFYDVSTSAKFTGYLTVCFVPPALQFPNLRLMKFENGGWVDVTQYATYPWICSISLTNLSPLAIVY